MAGADSRQDVTRDYWGSAWNTISFLISSAALNSSQTLWCFHERPIRGAWVDRRAGHTFPTDQPFLLCLPSDNNVQHALRRRSLLNIPRNKRTKGSQNYCFGSRTFHRYQKVLVLKVDWAQLYMPVRVVYVTLKQLASTMTQRLELARNAHISRGI